MNGKPDNVPSDAWHEIRRTSERMAVVEARVDRHDKDFREMQERSAAQFSSLETRISVKLDDYGKAIKEFMETHARNKGRDQGVRESLQVAAWVLGTCLVIAGVVAAWMT